MMFRHNLALKAFALLIAMIIWVELNLLAEQQGVVPLRVTIKNGDNSSELANQLPKVPFHVQGRGWDILHLKLSKTSVEIDAEDLEQAAKRISELDYEIKNRPANLDLEIIGPVKNYDLVAGTQQNVPEEPSLVVAADGNGRAVADKARAAQPSTPSPAKEEQITTKVLENISITSISGMLYTPSSATLKVEGKPSALAALPRGLVVVAAEKPDASGTYEITVRLPEGVELLDYTPKRVRQRK